MNINVQKFCSGADRAAMMLKSLANTHRLMILCRLHEGECSVGELTDFVGLTQSALSQHLARLRNDGIVETRRESQTIYYRIADEQAVRLIKELYALFCAPPSLQPQKRRK